MAKAHTWAVISTVPFFMDTIIKKKTSGLYYTTLRKLQSRDTFSVEAKNDLDRLKNNSYENDPRNSIENEALRLEPFL